MYRMTNNIQEVNAPLIKRHCQVGETMALSKSTAKYLDITIDTKMRRLICLRKSKRNKEAARESVLLAHGIDFGKENWQVDGPRIS